MQKSKRAKLSCKALGLFCALALLIGALYVPMSFGISAANPLPVTADETTVFGFDDSFGNSTLPANKTEYDNTGIGYCGWQGEVQTDPTDSTNKVLHFGRANKQGWATSGGYRLNRLSDGEYKVYNLKPDTTYVVSMKVRVSSSSEFTDDAKTPYECYVDMGYGAKAGTDGNYVNSIDKKLTRIVSTKAGSGVYTLTTEDGQKLLSCSNEWQNVIYQFTTPSDLGSFDHALTLFGSARTGFVAQIDDLSVTQLGSNTGVVVLSDEYSAKTEVYFGTIGEELVLPDISDRAQQEDHLFNGWYADAGRTEKIEKITYTAAKQTVYTAWQAPVTVTFVDRLNNTQTTVSGMAGESLSYPVDPTDPAGAQWFMGWYTSEGYTEEHTSGVFGFSNITLYAYWKGRVPELTQNFEDYPYCKKEVVTDTSSAGVQYKSYKDTLVIGTTYTLQSEVTASPSSTKALKFVWDHTMTRNTNDPNDPNLMNPDAYNAPSRYRDYDNFIWLGSGIEDKQAYIVSFKVKVEKADTQLAFYALSASSSNAWGGCVRYTTASKAYEVGDEWQTVSFQLTTNFKSETATTMYLGVTMAENKDVVLYIDDVEIKAVAQPYESLILVHNGYSDEVINLVGTRGETVNFPTLTHPNEAPFKGWYLDDKYTEEVDFTTFPRKTTSVYAKWGAAAVKFNESYTWDEDGTSFGHRTVSVVEGSGVGYDDNYALRFRFKGDEPFNDAGTLECTRFNMRDHCAAVAKGVTGGSLYRVSYYYKASNASNCAANITVATGFGPNLWVPDCWKQYNEHKVTVTKGDNGWNKVEFFFYPDVKSSGTWIGNTMFLIFGVENNKETNYAELYVDNVLVEDVSDSYGYIYCDGNDANATSELVVGQIGDPIQFPKLVNGKFKIIGWYLDPECTIPFTATTIPSGNVHIYAHWYIPETYPMTFEYGHPFNPKYGLTFGSLYTYAEGAGMGVDDDYCLRWRLKGTETYVNGSGETVKYATRATERDHVVPILKGMNTGDVYRVSFYYMTTKSTNVDSYIKIVSGHKDNIWINACYKVYDIYETKIPAGGVSWQKVEFYMSANVIGTDTMKGDTLYLQMALANTNESNFADIRIDNVDVEKINAPYIFFECNNSEDVFLVRGNAGEKIKYPANPTRLAYDFKGWYKDIECTEKFDLKEFAADTAVTVYAGWAPATTVTYSFEKYDLGPTPGAFYVADAKVEKGVAKSGKQALHFGNRYEGKYNAGCSYAAIAQGKEIFRVQRGYQYVAVVNYNAKKVGQGSLNLELIAGTSNNYWAGNNSKTFLTPTMSVTKLVGEKNEGRWMNKTFVLDTSVIDEKITDPSQRDGYTYLYLRLTGAKEWDVWIDDITITRIPKGKSVVCIDNFGYNQIPTYLLGTPGQSYSSKLPDLKPDEMYFKGYYTKDSAGAFNTMKREDMVFQKEPTTLFARFTPYEIIQDYEGDYLKQGESYVHSYSTYDFDYEIYDATKQGNSKDNVTNGNFSLHRMGNSMYFENATILTMSNQISEGERYTVTFKVKLGKYRQTDGAVKIVSGRSPEYAWHTSGDYYPVVAIKDLLDGQWHEVSYTFNSVEAWASIQTPGYVELFIDEFKFSLVDKNTPLSNPVSYTEYVPAKRDADGNLVDKSDAAIDVSSIIDISLYTNNNIWVWIIVAAAAVLVLGGGVLAFVLIKKKKRSKA